MESSSVEIRKAVEEDLNAILEIYNEAILNTTGLFEYTIFSKEYIIEWFNRKKSHNLPVIVASQEKTILGFGSYGSFRDRPAYKYTVESTVYIEKNSRRKGIGSLLLSSLVKHALSQNLHVIVASIESSNIASLKLHKRIAFEQVAEFKQVGYKFNTWLDLKFLQLILPTPESPNEFS